MLSRFFVLTDQAGKKDNQHTAADTVDFQNLIPEHIEKDLLLFMVVHVSDG